MSSTPHSISVGRQIEIFISAFKGVDRKNVFENALTQAKIYGWGVDEIQRILTGLNLNALDVHEQTRINAELHKEKPEIKASAERRHSQHSTHDSDEETDETLTQRLQRLKQTWGPTIDALSARDSARDKEVKMAADGAGAAPLCSVKIPDPRRTTVIIEQETSNADGRVSLHSLRVQLPPHAFTVDIVTKGSPPTPPLSDFPHLTLSQSSLSSSSRSASSGSSGSSGSGATSPLSGTRLLPPATDGRGGSRSSSAANSPPFGPVVPHSSPAAPGSDASSRGGVPTLILTAGTGALAGAAGTIPSGSPPDTLRSVRTPAEVAVAALAAAGVGSGEAARAGTGSGAGVGSGATAPGSSQLVVMISPNALGRCLPS